MNALCAIINNPVCVCVYVCVCVRARARACGVYTQILNINRWGNILKMIW